jgi:two-component system sensor histidine kinase KdpD
MSVVVSDLALEEVVPLALDSLGPAAASVTTDIADDLPLVRADPGLLERVVANLMTNALRYSPPDRPPHVAASALGDHVELRVVDRGPGISRSDRDRIFLPFQRLGDTDSTTGVGLGLALARGLTEAMGGTVTADDTPGGGLTMTVTLPAGSSDTGLSGGPPLADAPQESPILTLGPVAAQASERNRPS